MGGPAAPAARADRLRRHQGIRFVLHDPYLRVFAGVGAGTVGVLVAGMSCGGVFGAAVATRVGRRLGTARAFLVCNVGALPFGLLIPMAGRGARLALPVVAGVVAGNVIKDVFRQRYTPSHLLGRVIVSMQFVNLGAIPLGGLFAGVLAAAIGVRPAMWVVTAILALSGGLALLGPVRHRRDLPGRHGVLRDHRPPGDR
ncbi:MAG TPA: MFS transporter, partial [Micromonosporaceae bacterium]|nr:MFS transporter [Micromonosporaceae bacterium]